MNERLLGVNERPLGVNERPLGVKGGSLGDAPTLTLPRRGRGLLG